MATEAWTENFPVACQTLLAPELVCQAALEERLNDIAAEFTWLEEIVDEAYKLFAVKSNKLEQMPKTPCVKQKRQKGTRQVKTKEAETEDVTGAALPKAKPTKLKFETDSLTETDGSDESGVGNSGRPVRGCRKASKPVYTEEDGAVKRSTRQSRKAVQKSAEATSTRSSSQQSRGKENQPPVVNLADIIEDKHDETREKSKVTGVSQKKKSEQDSPSVRARAKAYENMLKQRVSKSPVKVPRSATPGSDHKKATTSNNTGTLKGKVPQGKRSRSSNKLSRHSLHRHSSTRRSRNSQRSSRSSSSKHSTESNGTRQPRTRLRLKKPNQGEQKPEASEEESLHSDSCEAAATAEDRAQVSTPQNKELADRGSADMFDAEDHNQEEQHAIHTHDPLNETELVVTEVFEIHGKDQPAKLREFEMTKTKTTPVGETVKQQTKSVPAENELDPPGSSSDQGFNDGDGDSETESVNTSAVQNKNNETFTKESSDDNENTGIPTRTRTRAQQKDNNKQVDNTSKGVVKTNKDSGIDTGNRESAAVGNSTFTKDKAISPQEEGARTTRTRARAQKESVASEASSEEKGPSTRTRQRKIEGSQQERVEKSVKDEPFKLTRSRMRKVNDPDRLNICGSDDEVITGSPAIDGQISVLSKGGKKRMAEERGLSPRPKRSCVGADQSTVSTNSPLSTSSPIKRKGDGLNAEERDVLLSPRRSPKPFKFNSAQKKTTDFLNRTPGFGQNTTRVYSFLSNTPTCRNSGVLSSFLKRNTPPPKQNIQIIQEQKKQKLMEKESRDKERLKRAAELKKRRIEEQKRQREEKEKRVAEAREMRMRKEQEQMDKINKKLEDKASLKEKILEERTKEEREKQKLRLKKQMEADARRKQEEEDRLRKILEQEEEARMQEEFMQRKKDFEETERRRQIAEEKRKQEDRLAELEQKRLEEKARLKQLEEEKERERERFKQEREKQFALERAERERQERERKEEKDRKLKEEIEKLKTMEKERQKRQEQETLRQQQQEAQQKELKQLINKHNSSINKQSSTTTTSVLNTTQTLSAKDNSSSYDITPVKVKVVNAKLKDPENYDIDDKGSDESTDDEEAPKKRIPEWATGIPLNTALIRQHMNPPNLEEIFRTHNLEPPNLAVMFAGGRKKRRYYERTSSAIWTSPIMKH